MNSKIYIHPKYKGKYKYDYNNLLLLSRCCNERLKEITKKRKPPYFKYRKLVKISEYRMYKNNEIIKLSDIIYNNDNINCKNCIIKEYIIDGKIYIIYISETRFIIYT